MHNTGQHLPWRCKLNTRHAQYNVFCAQSQCIKEKVVFGWNCRPEISSLKPLDTFWTEQKFTDLHITGFIKGHGIRLPLKYNSMKCFIFWENERKQGRVFPLYYPNSDDRLSLNFHRFVIFIHELWYTKCGPMDKSVYQYCADAFKEQGHFQNIIVNVELQNRHQGKDHLVPPPKVPTLTSQDK